MPRSANLSITVAKGWSLRTFHTRVVFHRTITTEFSTFELSPAPSVSVVPYVLQCLHITVTKGRAEIHSGQKLERKAFRRSSIRQFLGFRIGPAGTCKHSFVRSSLLGLPAQRSVGNILIKFEFHTANSFGHRCNPGPPATTCEEVKGYLREITIISILHYKDLVPLM